MYLAEDELHSATPARASPETPTSKRQHASMIDLITGPCPGGKWQNFPNSFILHHGSVCCDIAHEWLLAFDFAQLNGADLLSGPRWIREHSRWGPSTWPIHWCEAVHRKVLDCGAHAAIAQETFVARGVTAFRAQFVQRYNADAVASWRGNWEEKGASCHWIDGDAIYHEGNAILIGTDEVKFWDGSAGGWINPRQESGYGSLVAVRVGAEASSFPDGLRWGGYRLAPNQWVAL